MTAAGPDTDTAPPGANYGTAILASQIVFLIMTIGAVVLRFMARIGIRGGLTMSDYSILIALVIVIGICAGNVWGVSAGFLGIGVAQMQPTQLELFFKLVFTTTLLNFAALGVSKISIALFYRTIFSNRRFKIAIYVYIGLAVAWMFVAILMFCIAIQPIQGWWLPIEKVTLFNIGNFIAIITSINMVLDVVLLCMPLFVIGTLKMSLTRKFQAGGILALGFLVCVGSALHLYFATLLNSTDSSVIAGNFICASLEVSGSVFTACLPTFAPLLRGRRWRNLFRTFHSSTDSGVSNSRNQYGADGRSRTSQHASRASYGTSPRNWPNHAANSFTIRSQDEKETDEEPLRAMGIMLKQTFGSEHHPAEEDIELSDVSINDQTKRTEENDRDDHPHFQY